MKEGNLHVNFDSKQAQNKFKRLRYDRIIIVAVFFAAIIFIICLIHGAVSKDKKNINETSSQTSTNSTADTTVHTGGRIEFQKIYVSYEEIHKGELILVNNEHEYIFPDDESSQLICLDEVKNDFYKIKDINISMNKLAAKALNSMMSGFFQEKSNKDIMITGAYISKNQQNLMYNQALENSIKITKGGYSEHHTGLAVDMSIYSEKENLKPFSPVGKYEWIKENCTKYGFVRRYPPEKSDITGIKDHFEHFRYVGIPHAYYMTENNLTLEEYIELLKNYTFGNKSLSFSCYSKNYEVYYIKAKSSGGNVDVYVPSTNSYTISGNNVDGFIITVEK